MLIIKRYPNRKLYDTEAKKYITLDGISTLIREGQEVQVIDHASGENLTTIVLTQIIFEQEKKQSGFLPQSVLRGLVQAGGDTLGSLRRTLASPLDMLSHVDEEIRHRVDVLVKRGEITAEEGKHLAEKLLAQGRKVVAGATTVSKDELTQRLDELGVPTRNEIDALSQQLEALESALDQMATPENASSEETN